MEKIKHVVNDSDCELRVLLEPIADEVILSPGSELKVVAEVPNSSLKFEEE